MEKNTMKTFYFNFEDGLEQKYIDWAKEAVQDFINLFPEYKDNFATTERNITYDNLGISILQTLAEQNRQYYEKMKRTQQSTEDFDETSFWQMFEKLPDGSYKPSFEKQIALATRNGMIDIQKLSQLQSDSFGNMYSASTPILVNVTKQKAHGNIRGISSETSINISAGTCANLGYTGEDLKTYFKDIIIHELGHTFNATHEERQNTVENLGSHCTDKNCLMYEYAYTNESFNRRKKLKNPFCADCMASMHDYMQNFLHFSKTQTQTHTNTNQLQSVNILDLPMFKDISEGELIALDNYMQTLEDNNIQRSPQEQLLDMISVFASARGSHNLAPQKGDNIIGTPEFLLATAKTDWSDAAKLSILKGKIYSFKRYVKYTPPFKIEDIENPTPEVKEIEDAQLYQGNLARVSDEGYWIRKYGQGYFDDIKADPNKEVHRFILNVNPSVDLFKKLDDFAVKYRCQYKFPNLLSWDGRADTVVIYTSDDRIAEQKKELVKIARPYVRTERMTNSLDGVKIADGIFIAKERDKADILNLAKQAESLLPQLAERLRNETNSSHRHPLSLGEFLSFEAIIDNVNAIPSPNHTISLPELNFENPGRREIFYIYNHLQKQNAPLAQKISDLSDKYNSDWAKMALDPEFKQIKDDFVKTLNSKNQNQTVQVSNEKLNEINDGTDKKFKKALREVFQPAAQKEGSTYVEDIKAVNYQAQIKHSDGRIDYIEASSANNVSLTSADKDGNPQVPGMERFRNLVEYAQKQNKNISFGDIKSPEFKAKLMIACLEAQPPVKMKGAPNLDKEFLDSLSDELKNQLHQAVLDAKRKQQNNNPNDNGKQTSEPTVTTPDNHYKKSQIACLKSLEAKEKLGKISKMEKAELDYIRADISRNIELEKAKAKYNSEDPRFEEHKQKSGLKIENYYYSSKTRTSDTNWKLHLDVVPNRNHPTTKAISEMLEKLDIEHKIAKGGENGKGMTIYVGNYADTLRLSKEINARFGKQIETSPCYVDQNLSEHYFNPKVSGRFWMQNTFKTQYPRSSVFGICPATGTKNNEMEALEAEYRIFDLAQKNGIIPAEDKFSDGSYNLMFFYDGDFHKSYIFHNIEAYCSHKLYEKELGEFYCGKHVDKFEKDFFGDKIPEKGTPERALWDKVADEYVAFVEKTHPNVIQKMKQETQGYKSVDFSKLPPLPQNMQGRGNGRTA